VKLLTPLTLQASEHGPRRYRAPELLLIGTGRRLLQLDPKLRAGIRAMGVTVDVMTTVRLRGVA